MKVESEKELLNVKSLARIEKENVEAEKEVMRLHITYMDKEKETFVSKVSQNISQLLIELRVIKGQ